jgi:hypothetical protein
MINCPTKFGHFGICRIYGHEWGHGILDLVEEVQDQQEKPQNGHPGQKGRNGTIGNVRQAGEIPLNGPLIRK